MNFLVSHITRKPPIKVSDGARSPTVLGSALPGSAQHRRALYLPQALCIYIFAHLASPLLILTHPILHTNSKSKTQNRIGALCLVFLLDFYWKDIYYQAAYLWLDK